VPSGALPGGFFKDMEFMRAYKVFVSYSGVPKFLYHGLRGSRIVTLDKWLEAEVKWANEGSNPYYYTAFHVYMKLGVLKKWVRSVKKFEDRFVTIVSIERTRDKPTAGSAVLAELMRLDQMDWENRIELKEFA